jgi:hypothetical protein
MIKHFDGATKGNHVLISETKLKEILKTSCCHVKMPEPLSKKVHIKNEERPPRNARWLMEV